MKRVLDRYAHVETCSPACWAIQYKARANIIFLLPIKQIYTPEGRSFEKKRQCGVYLNHIPKQRKWQDIMDNSAYEIKQVGNEERMLEKRREVLILMSSGEEINSFQDIGTTVCHKSYHFSFS